MRLFAFSNLMMFFFLILPSYTFSQVNIEKFRKVEDNRDFSGSFELDILSKIGNVDVTRINEFKDIRILSETDLIIRLGKHFSLAISFRMRYDSQPPHGIKLLDTAVKTGLVLNY